MRTKPAMTNEHPNIVTDTINNAKNFKHLYFITLLAGLLVLWLSIGGFPIMLHHSPNTVFPSIQTNDSTINPLKNIDMKNGKAILILSADDWSNLPKGMPARRVLVCTDAEMLQQLKDIFSFEISGGDMATVESELWVYSHDTLVLMTNIDISPNHVSIQNEQTGWAKSIEYEQLCILFTQFKPYRKPLLTLQ